MGSNSFHQRIAMFVIHESQESIGFKFSKNYFIVSFFLWAGKNSLSNFRGKERELR